MHHSKLIILILLTISSCKPDVSDPFPPEPESEGPHIYEGYSLLWNDEFNEGSIDLLNWTYEIGDGTDYGLPAGWGNNELQIYTTASENAYIESLDDSNSALIIEAQEDGNGGYSSAKLTTQELQEFRFGRIEARIKVPTGQGLWPAFWMLGSNIEQIDWPGCGEIDIMEHIGSQTDIIYGNAHYTDSDNGHGDLQGSTSISSGFSEEFHEFRLDWTPEDMTFSLDGEAYHSISIADDMKEFLRPFYLILNVAVGGSWPGSPDESTELPQKMYVDWLRVYTIDGLNAAAAPDLDIEEETFGTFIPQGIAQYALNSQLTQFPSAELNSFGAGGEPEVFTSDISIEGDSSLLFMYPGGNWGGGWFEMEETQDMSTYADGHLIFSLRQSGEMADAEIKVEAAASAASVWLIDYAPVSIENEFLEYSIPISDFTALGLDLGSIRIPFALWNPVDESSSYPAVNVHIDNVYWQE